jgi:hypothetical protein
MRHSGHAAPLAILLVVACNSRVELGAMLPPCCDSDAGDDARLASDASDASDAAADTGSAIDAARGVDSVTDASVDPDTSIQPDGAGGGASDGTPSSRDATDATSTDATSADGRPPSDGADLDGPSIGDRTMPDGTVDDPTCPLPAPDPVVCLDPDGGVPGTRTVDCWRPTRKVASASYPTDLMTDSRGVYWANSGSGEIFMLPHGATAPTFIAAMRVVTASFGFRIDDDAIYFHDETDGGQFVITSIKRDGTGRTPLVTSTWGMLAMTADRIYFNDTTGQVAWIPKSGGTPVVTPIAASQVLHLVIDDARLYWFDGPSDDRTVKRIAKDGTTVETIADHQGPIRGFIQDTTHLYWLQGADVNASVKRVAKTGTTVETLATDLGQVTQTVEQGDGVLLLARGSIVEVPKTGGCARVLVAPLSPTPWAGPTIGGFVVDGVGIYWTAAFGMDLLRRSFWRSPRTGGVAVQVMEPPIIMGSGYAGVALTPTQVWWLREFSIEVMDRR